MTPELTALLERRAERIREEQADTETQDDLGAFWVAEFQVADESYAIKLEQVRATIPLKFVTPVPLAPPHVLGVVRYQEELITAISLASVLGVRGWRIDPSVLLVVDKGGEHLVALDCEEVPKAVPLPVQAVEQARVLAKDPVLHITTPDLRYLRLIDDVDRLIDHRGGRDPGD